MILLHETSREDGTLARTYLDARDGSLVLLADEAPPRLLPLRALEGVMERYGKPLAEGLSPDGPSLDLGDGHGVAMLRHRGYYDVIARDYVVYRAPGREPLAELATAVVAALFHLADAFDKARANATF